VQTPVDSATTVRCCGTPLSVVALTRADDGRALVELVRCSGCGQSRWRLQGRQVDKSVALGALSAVYAPGATARAPRRPRPPRVAAAPAAAAPPPALAQLLAGWQVHGTG
jgi:hypothetical protein